MASKGENHSIRHAMKEENEAKNVKFKTVPCKYLDYYIKLSLSII